MAGTIELAADERICFRFQPKGLSLFGHTSGCSSDEAVEDGYVFCETSIHACGAYVSECGGAVGGEELVIFVGADVYDPGDVHGFAAMPVRELARVDALEWWERRQQFGK